MVANIRPRRLEDDEELLAVWNRTKPDLPPFPVENYRHSDTVTPADKASEKYVAEHGGRIVGTSWLLERWYTQGEGSFELNVVVEPDLWGQGIGTRLYEHGLVQAVGRGARRLFTLVREGDAHSERFATHRGFRPSGHTLSQLRLEPDRANLDRAREARQRLETQGIKIVSLAEVGEHEQLLRALHLLDHQASQDEPTSESPELMPFEQWRQLVLEEPGASTESYWVALDGDRPVGFTSLRLAGNAGDNGFTGVAREYRGRGIALALKGRLVEWARERGLHAIYTGNDLTNAPMLAINRGLGYEPVPASIEYVKELG